MNIEDTFINGLKIIHLDKFLDERGSFLKVFNFETYKEFGLETEYLESYFSISAKYVIRGMHFQVPPYDHTKLVYVSRGMILDVVLDIRRSSTTYKQFYSIQLNEKKPCVLYIPPGCAHGFKSLKEDSIVNYLQTSEYNKECDSGILWSSFGMYWGEGSFIISNRDRQFMEFKFFESPFK